MNPLHIFALLVSGVGLSCCHQIRNAAKNEVDTVSQRTVKAVAVTDTLTRLFEEALTADTIEFTSRYPPKGSPFMYFKSGHIISHAEKNAIAITSPNDSTYIVKVYGTQGGKWQLIDSITGLEALTADFAITYADFNFDHQPDIYIQASVSNGFPLSRGYLIIVDPATKRLSYHKEARDLANMKPLPKKKAVMSEEWLDYDDVSGRPKISIRTNKWVNGELRTVAERNVLIPKR